jgi:hypothetical protein
MLKWHCIFKLGENQNCNEWVQRFLHPVSLFAVATHGTRIRGEILSSPQTAIARQYQPPVRLCSPRLLRPALSPRAAVAAEVGAALSPSSLGVDNPLAAARQPLPRQLDPSVLEVVGLSLRWRRAGGGVSLLHRRARGNRHSRCARGKRWLLEWSCFLLHFPSVFSRKVSLHMGIQIFAGDGLKQDWRQLVGSETRGLVWISYGGD